MKNVRTAKRVYVGECAGSCSEIDGYCERLLEKRFGCQTSKDDGAR